MRRICMRIGLAAALILVAIGSIGPAASQSPQLPGACKELAFSVEQSFLTRGPVPSDGNPIISDGDLLGKGCIVCARNRDLTRGFDISPAYDLGLDAVDVLDAATYLIAFSTELDSPNRGQFTAGDFLATNGTIIPNVALTNGFGVGYDVGLDALQFIGDARGITGFMGEAKGFPRSYWLTNPTALSGMLRQWGIDIWFSTEEGVPSVLKAGFLDGDILSARDGAIVAAQPQLLPAGVPAGIPNRGVDFGLDALAAPRTAASDQLKDITFSTELLNEIKPLFTDGDILRFGDGVVMANKDLVRCFEPTADFLGLDALSGAPVAIAQISYIQLLMKQYEAQ